MEKEYFISLWLDTRRTKKNHKYPVKVRVFTPEPRIQKLYPTKFEFTKDEFKSIWETIKPREENKSIRDALRLVEKKAIGAAEKLSPFTFEEFEKLFLPGGKKDANNVVSLYNEAIAGYKRDKRIGTATNYECSLKSLLKYHGAEKLYFQYVTVQWLKDYERYITEDLNQSLTTVGIYLRPLRSIFHKANIDSKIYPFGKEIEGKYTIPEPGGTKKALTKDKVRILFQATPKTAEQEKAKAFWFFSYSCNGMNIKDIVTLKAKNISGDVITFDRAKTVRTKRKQSKIIAYLNSHTLEVIEKYGNPRPEPDDYVFPIIDKNANAEIQHRQIGNFVRFVNQNFLKFAKSAGLDEKISTYYARHSWATIAIQSGASMEFASEGLGHSNLSTTRAYFAGFEDEKKREISKK